MNILVSTVYWTSWAISPTSPPGEMLYLYLYLQDGRYGLYAPATGGMEMLDLRTGKVCKTLIPKVIAGREIELVL